MKNIEYTKKSLIIVLAIFAILLLTGGTYAYWTWSSQINKNVVFNTLSGLEDYIIYDEGESHFVGNFQPTDTFCENVSNTISFKKTSEVSELNFLATIYMDINSIGENIASSSDVYWVVTEGNNTIDCSNGLNSDLVLASGTFNSVTAGSTLKLIDQIPVTEDSTKFTVWMWINSAGTDLSKLSGETIDANIWTEFMLTESLKSKDENLYTESILNGTDPELESGMIPVTISDTGAVTVADTAQEWYKYEDKEWANAVLVNSTSRSTYINQDGSFNANTPIPESNILAYYVWIPRYKYTFPKADGNPETISIVFENNQTTKSIPASGSASGTEYYTHPAFTFGTKELNGIWVGKFETTGDVTTPTILPDELSLVDQAVSEQFTTAISFAGGNMDNSTGNVSFSGNNTYGLTNQTDSHMMKNSEWGAVAYLSHSQYGINEEIRINNYLYIKIVEEEGWGGLVEEIEYNYPITGCGAATPDESESETCGIPYGTPSTEMHLYPQSTTGNITGVFDVSGGAEEYVMGKLDNAQYDYSRFDILPASKYYNLYLQTQFDGDMNTNIDKCTLETCGGQALYETKNWYNDSSYFVDGDSMWFLRGYSYDSGASAGAFDSGPGDGLAYYYRGFRAVLVKGA